MKIQDITCKFIDEFLFVEIRTDNGIVGLGEVGTWAFLEASASVIETFKRYLIGQDPLLREHHWQYLYRCYHFRGAVIMGALSAIDVALWDIAGKFFGVPCYQLMGGKTRDKVRVYYHVFGKCQDELIENCINAKEKGFTAVGHLTPFADESRSVSYFKTHVERIRAAIETVGKYRAAVGDDVDLCIEIHRQLAPHEAIVLGQGIAEFNPYFFEDPVRPDNFDVMADVQRAIPIAIATGERIHTVEEFSMLLERRACRFIRPDVCMCGGLTHAKKIAAVAEGFGVQVIPHNPLSPVSTAVCVQLAASIPNFAIQEYPIGEKDFPKAGIIQSSLELENGFLKVPEIPGIGVELRKDAEKEYPYRPRAYMTRLHEDGSVFDQ